MRILLVLAGLLVTLTGCGVRPEPHPRPLPRASLPSELQASPSPTARPTGPLRSTTVYLVRGSRLVAVRRSVPAGDALRGALTALAVGPTAAEAAQQLASDVPSGARAVSATITDRVVTVQLSDGFLAVRGQPQVLAVAQVVYTVDALEPGHGVRIRVGSRLLDLPTGTGMLVDRPLVPADFPDQAPSPATS